MAEGDERRLSDDDKLELLRRMVLLRSFDERAVNLQRQGRIGNYPPCWGEEATQVGPLFALRDRDWVFPSYRQQFVGMFRGISPSTFLKYRSGYGGRVGFWNPREFRVAPITISIATHLPHAVGLAWAAQIRGDDVVSLAWFGDGATSEGDFHEALNFASVRKAPVVFFCTNNQWAISTPFERQSGSENVAAKAAAYGMKSIQIEGFDVVACWNATGEAIDHARSGGGPVLIEAITYRVGPHATADDPSRYRDESESEKWRAREPIARLAAELRAGSLIDEESERSMWADAVRAVDAAVEEMESCPVPGPEVLFETTYASGRPWPLQEGLDELNRLSR